MSFLSSIESAAHTAANWFMKAIQKAQQVVTTVAPVADRVFPWAKLVIDGILVAEGQGAITPEANNVIDEINRDLDIAAAALHDVGPTPTVTSALVATASNIDSLVAAGHVKNPANVSLIKNVVTSLLSLVGLQALPGPASNSATS